MSAEPEGITYVIPCGGRKLDHAAPARALYVGSMFRQTLDRVLQCAALDEAEGLGPVRVLILSARYGLVRLDDVLEPYEQRMDAPGSVSADTLAGQARALGIDWGAAVYALLPRPYLARLDEALRTLDVYVQDVYEACTGNLQQKRVNVSIARPTGQPAGDRVDEPGPVVWIGGDVSAFWWGTRILVSYGRLRESSELPAASAPYVVDSRGFNEISDHGRWTISAEQYAADLDRYWSEIGRFEWAVPQDWPAAAHLLARTGLTEHEHQARTIASVVELRRLAPHLPIICVVTGETLAGCLRHVAMYRAAGIDLLAETLPVGVGALVGRPPTEAAAILRALHGAGLRRLHGFGVKGRVLDLAGDVLADGSVDSAGWSAEARRRGGQCPHGVVEWERNCPVFAQQWADGQRARAVAAALAIPAQRQPELPFTSAWQLYDMPADLVV